MSTVQPLIFTHNFNTWAPGANEIWKGYRFGYTFEAPSNSSAGARFIRMSNDWAESDAV
jgi:hypothetical protein